jgi:alpha,alpha-trehalose phosphorylase
MLKRTLKVPPEYLYPADPWRIVETAYSDEYFARAETGFALSNGYVGIRGTFDEGEPARAPGAYVNGFHETWQIVHAEAAYGLARTGQTGVNVPDATPIRLYVDDEPLFVPTARLRDYERALDMRAGTVSRRLTWATPAGKHVAVRSCRLVSLEHRHVVAIAYEVVLPDHAAPVVIASEVVNRQDAHLGVAGEESHVVDPRRSSHIPYRVLNARIAEADGARLRLGYETASSRMTLGLGVDHVVDTAAAHDIRVAVECDRSDVVVTVEAEPGVPIRIVKFIAYHSSRTAPPRELLERCSRTLDRVVRDGFDALLEEQRENLDRFWSRADVSVELAADAASAQQALGWNPTRTQQAIRWNLWQVGQATWRAEGSGVPAKGLTGPGYEGHYFWDTEVYVLPFLSYTWPRIARNLLRFRHSMLGEARRRAGELGQRGAMFPWRTINGEEASAYYQAGTAQYHINADIAYAIRRYVHARGDETFLVEAGAEMLVETARLWDDLGFHGDDGEFHIHGVTGPDEYTTVVNDNAYTNLLARLNLAYAAEVVRRLENDAPEAHARLVADTRLEPGEVAAWERAAAAMHVPYDERRGIHPQDAQFLDREMWDLDNTPPEHFPLLLHYHPLELYRRQVIKQADVVLAMFLLSGMFSDEQKRANFDYYDALTTGDSSLSACVQSIIAADVGDHRRALEYFRFALLMDLADAAGNASDGVHIASAAGVWQALVFGFGGVRDFEGELSISPRLPPPWRSLAFSLRYRDRQIRVRLTHDEEEYRLDDGAPVDVTIRGERHRLTPGDALTLTPPGAAQPSPPAAEGVPLR